MKVNTLSSLKLACRQGEARSALALTRCIIVENKKENKNVSACAFGLISFARSMALKRVYSQTNEKCSLTFSN